MTARAKRSPLLLITGASGGLAQAVVARLKDRYQMVGVDPRPLPFQSHFPGDFFQVDYTHRKMAEIFGAYRFTHLLHMGRVQPSLRTDSKSRFHYNVLGTRNLLLLALKNRIRNLLILSTYHVYGASLANHAHLTEEDPLRASQTFSELSDAIELDHSAVTFLWRHRAIRTLVLRPVNVIGPHIRNTISNLLRAPVCPKIMGFDPLFQFIHETDVARGIELCLNSKKAGIYNLAGEGLIPLSQAMELTGARPMPVPGLVASVVIDTLSRLGISVPHYLIDFLRYPAIVSDARFRRDFGFEPTIQTVAALKNLHP